MKLLAGLWLFEGLSEPGGNPSMIAHLAVVWRPQFLTIRFLLGLFGFSQDLEAGLPQREWIQKKKKQPENYNAFYKLISEWHSSLLLSFLFIKSKSQVQLILKAPF